MDRKTPNLDLETRVQLINIALDGLDGELSEIKTKLVAFSDSTAKVVKDLKAELSKKTDKSELPKSQLEVKAESKPSKTWQESLAEWLLKNKK